MNCPKCGHPNKDDASVCSRCYFDLKSGRAPIKEPPIEVRVRRTPSPLPTAKPASPPPPPPGYQPAPQNQTVLAHPPVYQAPPAFSPAPLAMDYAGFGVRLAAFIIDVVILWIVGFLIGMAMGVGASAVPADSMTQEQRVDKLVAHLTGSALVNNIIDILYFIGMNTAFGATLGKMALGIKIVKVDGSPMGIGSAILRYIVETILAIVTCGLMYISVAVSQTKQGWHDSVAGTVVIKT